MLNLDTIKMSIPFNEFLDIELKYFIVEQKVDFSSGVLISKTYQLKNEFKPYGLRSIEIRDNYHNKDIVVELSAKALGKYYHYGINKYTINYLLSECLESKLKHILNIDYNAILYKSTVFRADVTSTIQVENPDMILNALGSYRGNAKYEIKNYQPNKGIEINRNTKTNPERMIIYNKEKEVHNDSNIDSLSKEYFKNTLRFEINLRKFDKMKRLLKIENNDLSSILESEANPILELFKNIFQFNQIIKLYNNSGLKETEEVRFCNMVRDIGKESIASKCDFDIKSIKSFVKLFIKSQTSINREINNFKKICNKKISNESNTISIYKEIENKLNQANQIEINKFPNFNYVPRN